ncbi:AAA family ATPase [Rossellomorea sp. BNER]|uniref:ATP-dependent Clp protease ATP-binding subunit n=1 Tax=Rossellomorea sp. BNER TaxID=2962031 RepID=UPI003AF30AE2|nr:AAA family ATPase [Rossellomorea sp. BNER]
MLCQQCQERKANINLHLNINGQNKEMHLCTSCYQQTNRKIGSGALPSNQNGQNFSAFDGFFKNSGFPKMSTGVHKAEAQNNSFLNQFGRNLTSIAKEGLIDPVIGRNEEIKRVIEVLNRRNKNNPVLIGEPGVGKTAIAEGLANRIAEGEVPSKLRNKQVYLLDVSSLVANTGVRGQFEERIQQLISEVQKQENVILFIDEIHLLVGAGSAEGSMDAGNILKPALARGELQVVGATTLKEYRQIEKDAALERRFQPIQVSEPSLDEALDILHGLRKTYEDYHNVSFQVDALKACVNLSHRYIQDRFLPDKAIDLLDEAGSKLNLSIKNSGHNSERLKQIENEKQKALADENYEFAAKLRDEELKIEHQMEEGTEHVRPQVTVAHIQELIEKKTGIPVGKLQSDDQLKVKYLEENLSKNVIGQREAVEKVAKAIRRSRAGLKSKNRPIGSFLFVGPTGVGKTELTKTLAEELFGSKEALIRLDMSEFMEKHSVSKLIGSPPGYVGHDEAGQLSEKVRRNPYSIILLDEIEKAHPDVQHMFLQILEDGRLTDSQGRTVSFKETVIVMTSNAGVEVKNNTVGFETGAIQESTILASLTQYFRPEFLNRLDNIIEFNSLSKESLLSIVELLINELKDTLNEQGITLSVNQEVKDKIVELGYHLEYGARPLRRVIQEKIEDSIADILLDLPETKTLNAFLDEEQIQIK